MSDIIKHTITWQPSHNNVTIDAFMDVRVHKIESDTVVIILPGVDGSVDGYENKYVKMAENIVDGQRKSVVSPSTYNQRLTIAEVIDKLKPVINEHGYKEFQLGQPDMGKQVVVPFNMIDGKSRSEDESRKNLNKLFSEQLAGTNWRLVRSSLSYRMGYLSGKLKGYESDEDLLKLIS